MLTWWVKADSSNTNYDWYNYSEKKWANVVLVSSTNRDSYINGSVGTQIPESDILAYYVWIPRYKYKVFNINMEVKKNIIKLTKLVSSTKDFFNWLIEH